MLRYLWMLSSLFLSFFQIKGGLSGCQKKHGNAPNKLNQMKLLSQHLHFGIDKYVDKREFNKEKEVGIKAFLGYFPPL